MENKFSTQTHFKTICGIISTCPSLLLTFPLGSSQPSMAPGVCSSQALYVRLMSHSSSEEDLGHFIPKHGHCISSHDYERGPLEVGVNITITWGPYCLLPTLQPGLGCSVSTGTLFCQEFTSGLSCLARSNMSAPIKVVLLKSERAL